MHKLSCLLGREDQLVVQAEGVIYFSERLPDTVIKDKCKVSKKRRKRNETKIKVKLAKEKKGIWGEGWCIEKTSQLPPANQLQDR